LVNAKFGVMNHNFTVGEPKIWGYIQQNISDERIIWGYEPQF